MEVLRFVSPLLDENCYALISGEDVAIIDPGTATEEIVAFAKANAQRVRYILLTHRHFDHILGTYELIKICPSAKVCLHLLDKDCLISDSFSLADQLGISAEGKYSADVLLNEGDEIPFGSGIIKVLSTPGHSAGSVCYIIDDIIFSGDTLFKGSIGRTDFESGSMSDMQNSLKILSDLEGDFKVYPGHGDATTLTREKNTNPYMR